MDSFFAVNLLVNFLIQKMNTFTGIYLKNLTMSRLSRYIFRKPLSTAVSNLIHKKEFMELCLAPHGVCTASAS